MPDNVLTRPAAGGTLVRTPEEAALLREAFGTPTVSPEGQFAESRATARRLMFDNAEDKATTFAEGAIDALTLGLIHETGDAAETRRSVNSGSAAWGNALGTGLGLVLPTGPVKWVTEAGETVGKLAARTALRTETGMIARGLREAGSASALLSATAAGHQVLDVLLEDKPFAAEAIVDAAALGGVLGFGGGALLGGLSRASRSSILDQGGMIGDTAAAEQGIARAVRSLDESVEKNARVLGGLKEMRRAGRLGEVSDDFIRVRSAALRDAEKAQEAFSALKALPDDPKEYAAWGAARERYHAAVRELDDIMTPHAAEAPGAAPVPPITPAAPKGFANDADWARAEAASPSPAWTEGTVSPPRGDLPALDEAVAKLPISPRANAEGFMANLEKRGAARTVKEDLPEGAAQGAIQNAGTVVDNSAGLNAVADEWAAMTPNRVRPYDEAAAQVRASMDDLYKASGGRLDSARALGLLEKAGVKPSIDPMGPYVDSLWSMRRVARLAADESRGVKTDLGRGILGHIAALGAAGTGHPALAMAAEVLGMSGKWAATAGKLAKSVGTAAEKFLTTTRVRAVTAAAGNRPWVYSDKGPIKDPLERIQELRYLASNPEAVRARVLATAGDLATIAPEHVKAMQDCAVGKVQALAMRAPQIFWDKLGRPMSPPAGAMRNFYEFENAMHDLPGVLKAVGDGTATRAQCDALQGGWPAVHMKLNMGLLADPERIQNLNRARLRQLEMITGANLTNATDPNFLLRQAQAWAPAEPQQPPPRPQAFNINPQGAPTPSQANATGRAPGN